MIEKLPYPLHSPQGADAALQAVVRKVNEILDELQKPVVEPVNLEKHLRDEEDADD